MMFISALLVPPSEFWSLGEFQQNLECGLESMKFVTVCLKLSFE